MSSDTSKAAAIATIQKENANHIACHLIWIPVMRLINVHTFQLEEFYGEIPPYIILSHRWGHDETTYKDFVKGRQRGSGFLKVLNFCHQVRQTSDVGYAWVDTVCIDKKSSAELSEAINSMWSYYENSGACYAYLSDVSRYDTVEIVNELVQEYEKRPLGSERERHATTMRDKKYIPDLMDHFPFPPIIGVQEGPLDPPEPWDAFRQSLIPIQKSVWFKRGWTLQELLAPRNLVLLSEQWNVLGILTRGSGSNENIGSKNMKLATDELLIALSQASGISKDILSGQRSHQQANVAEKMGWLARRQTTRLEDIAYCALGLFGVHMPLLYGEGSNAFRRLQEEIIKISSDLSVFAWPMDPSDPATHPLGSILAETPQQFYDKADSHIDFSQRKVKPLPYAITNQGLELRLQKNTVAQLAGIGGLFVPLRYADPSSTTATSEYILCLVEQGCGHYDRQSSQQEPMRALFANEALLLQEDTTIYVHTPVTRRACMQDKSQEHFMHYVTWRT